MINKIGFNVKQNLVSDRYWDLAYTVEENYSINVRGIVATEIRDSAYAEYEGVIKNGLKL